MERLRIVDRTEWVDAIARSSKTSTADWIVGALGLATLLAVAMRTLYFLARRSFRAAAVAAVTAFSWLFFVGSPAYLGTLAITALGLGLAWWLHKKTARESLLQAANP